MINNHLLRWTVKNYCVTLKVKCPQIDFIADEIYLNAYQFFCVYIGWNDNKSSLLQRVGAPFLILLPSAKWLDYLLMKKSYSQKRWFEKEINRSRQRICGLISILQLIVRRLCLSDQFKPHLHSSVNSSRTENRGRRASRLVTLTLTPPPTQLRTGTVKTQKIASASCEWLYLWNIIST